MGWGGTHVVPVTLSFEPHWVRYRYGRDISRGIISRQKSGRVGSGRDRDRDRGELPDFLTNRDRDRGG